MFKPKIIQVQVLPEGEHAVAGVVALLSNGTLWFLSFATNEWTQLPQPGAPA